MEISSSRDGLLPVFVCSAAGERQDMIRVCCLAGCERIALAHRTREVIEPLMATT